MSNNSKLVASGMIYNSHAVSCRVSFDGFMPEYVHIVGTSKRSVVLGILLSLLTSAAYMLTAVVNE